MSQAILTAHADRTAAGLRLLLWSVPVLLLLVLLNAAGLAAADLRFLATFADPNVPWWIARAALLALAIALNIGGAYLCLAEAGTSRPVRFLYAALAIDGLLLLLHLLGVFRLLPVRVPTLVAHLVAAAVLTYALELLADRLYYSLPTGMDGPRTDLINLSAAARRATIALVVLAVAVFLLSDPSFGSPSAGGTYRVRSRFGGSRIVHRSGGGGVPPVVQAGLLALAALGLLGYYALFLRGYRRVVTALSGLPAGAPAPEPVPRP
jgi:hypothetical protein